MNAIILKCQYYNATTLYFEKLSLVCGGHVNPAGRLVVSCSCGLLTAHTLICLSLMTYDLSCRQLVLSAPVEK